MLNKVTAKEILQEFDKRFKSSSKDYYTKREIEGFLDTAISIIEKTPTCYDLLKKKLGITKSNKKDIQNILEGISDTLYSAFKRNENNDIRSVTLEKLLTFYIATFYPNELTAVENTIETYRKLKAGITININVNRNINHDFDTQYLFYCWNHEINDIEIGLVRLVTCAKDAEWERGSLHYFVKDDLSNQEVTKWKQDEDYRPLRVSKKSENLNTITILSGKQGDRNFANEIASPFRSSFRILIQDKTIDERKIMMGSYSVANSEGSKPTSGIGVFVRIGDKDNFNKYPLAEKVNVKGSCIITEAEGGLLIEHSVPDEVTNILFDRRDSLREIIITPNNYSENKLFDSFAQLPNRPHVNAIKEISGLYFGYHLQNDYGKPGADKYQKGALRTLILEIKTNGICYLLDDEEKHNPYAKPYFGFLSMKDYSNKKMLINLDREHEKYIEYHSWRLQFYIELKPDDILEGVVSGFSKKNNSPITSPIRFKKNNQFKSLSEFNNITKENYPLKAIFPSTFYKSDYPLLHHHVDLEKLLEWDEKAIPYFVSLNDNPYFNSPNQSLPHNFINIEIKQFNRFKNLIGNYYLVSCSHNQENRSISKVKVQLRNFGEAFFIYPEENEKNKFELFIGRWEMHENGQLLKIRLKYRKRIAKKLSEVITSEPQSHGDFIFQLNNITSIDKIEFLKSISVWVDYENENTILAKREFLFPASDIDVANKFPDNYLEAYQYKYPIIDFDEIQFFKGISYFETDNKELNKKRKIEFFEKIKDQSNNIIMVNKNSPF